MLREINEQLLRGQSLEKEDIKTFVRALEGETSPAELGAFLALLRKKKETASELIAFAQVFGAHATRFEIPHESIDIVGTGGDGAHTYNISTTAALLIAACGVPVAKHGSRASSSKCGSADLLEHLGVRIDVGPDHAKALLNSCGICFLFAPRYNPLFAPLVPVRKALGFRTTLNMLGPLLNPARPAYMLLGVSDPEHVSLYSEALRGMGLRRFFVFHGPGIDELACFGTSRGIFFDGKQYRELEVNPQQLGFSTHALSAIQGGDPEENAAAFIEVLRGTPGAYFETVVLNAAYGLYVSGRYATIEEALSRAEHVLQSGAAYDVFVKWIEHDKLST